MNFGRIAIALMGLSALGVGGAVFYALEYAYYEPVAFPPGAGFRLTPAAGGAPEAIPASNLTGIDGTSSPIRFRACFTTPLGLDELSASFRAYATPEPLNAPRWFDCFDAAAIGAALETGAARAYLSEAGVQPGVDRVVAVFPDGRAYAWQQLTELPED